jgi:Fic family protein
MAEKKKMTMTHMKEKRTVPEEVKNRVKESAQIKKTLITALASGPKTIPQIAAETKLAAATVTYYLMSLRKYGEIEESEETLDDEYYLYRLKKGR